MAKRKRTHNDLQTEGQTIQWPKEKVQTMILQTEGQTIQWPKEKEQKDTQ